MVDAVNNSNLILPAGDVKMGPFDYFVYSNSLVDNMNELDELPIKVRGNSWVTVNDVGKAEDSHQIQTNIVRIDGQKSVYIPIMKQGGDTNTIAVVDGLRELTKHLYDIPKQMVTSIVFDQSVYVKEAIDTVLHEGFLGLILTSLMILVFLGSFRATSAVLLSIPLSALAAFVVLALMGGTVNTMILGGMALAFSRVIDNSVISLENIYRHLEMGAAPMVAAEVGGDGSKSRRTRRYSGERGRFLSGDFSLRRLEVSVFRLGAGVLSFAAGFVCRGYDRDSPVLFALLEGGAARRGASNIRNTRSNLTKAVSHSWMDRFNARFNRMFNKVLGCLRAQRQAGAGASRFDGAGIDRRVSD